MTLKMYGPRPHRNRVYLVSDDKIALNGNLRIQLGQMPLLPDDTHMIEA